MVRISSAADASLARGEVSRLLHAPLGPDAAVQIALLNNAGLQAAYNRLGVAEAVMVQASRPPLPSFAFDWVKTSIELDVERQIVASILSLATWPARSKLAGIRFEQAELRAAEETLRLAAETRRAYIRAVAARQILTALNAAKASADLSASLSGHAHANRRGEQARPCQATGVCHRDRGASDGGAAASRRCGGAAHPAVGLVGNGPRQCLAEHAAAAARSCAQSRRGRAAGDGAKSRSRRGAARSRGTRPVLRTHAQDALHQCARRRRHLQDAEGQRRAIADGGGFNIAFEVPIYDFGKARVREAEQRYLEAVNRSARKRSMPRSEAREAYGAYKASYAIAAQYEHEVLPLRDTISAETELQFNAMQVDAFALLEAARAKADAQVASIEARRNFWLASTDLSVAVLGGGGLSDGRPIVSADASGTISRKDQSHAVSTKLPAPALPWPWSAPPR